MLTSYWVRCPHPGCHWFGSLMPRTAGASTPFTSPRKGEVSFVCPKCQGTWGARIVGDNVRTIPLEEAALQKA